MPYVTVDGIATYYEEVGQGPPVLMFAPGGFNAVVENWSTLGVYREVRPVEQLARSYRCVVFDRREAGRSWGRVERITWGDYVRHALGLLDHFGIETAHLMGACVGCSQAAAVAAAHPERVRSLILYSPAGGPRYRMTNRRRFGRHLAFVEERGLDGVVDLAGTTDAGFSQDARLGPWVGLIRRDAEFAATYASTDVGAYAHLIDGMGRNLFDRDTVPGVEPEDLLRLQIPALVVPGEDASHAPSAARYLQECLPASEYWDVPVAEQTASVAGPRLRGFLDAIAG